MFELMALAACLATIAFLAIGLWLACGQKPETPDPEWMARERRRLLDQYQDEETGK